jgi:hypothetical protein
MVRRLFYLYTSADQWKKINKTVLYTDINSSLVEESILDKA